MLMPGSLGGYSQQGFAICLAFTLKYCQNFFAEQPDPEPLGPAACNSLKRFLDDPLIKAITPRPDPPLRPLPNPPQNTHTSSAKSLPWSHLLPPW
jgi:hypothetical protein